MLAIERTCFAGLIFAWCLLVPSAGLGQDDNRADQPSATDELALRQGQVSDKFARLETLMLRMAELDAATDPRRAALLKRAVAESKDKHISLQLETIVKLLGEARLSRAIDNQNNVHDDLKSLLELLFSEARPARLQNEQARVRGYIKAIERILRQQRSVQARNEGGDDVDRLAEEQGRVAERTAELDRTMGENEGGPDPGEGEEEGEEEGEKEGQGQGQGSQQAGQQRRDDGFPPRKRIQAAKEKMKQAQQKLAEARRRDAVPDQEQAQQELQKAIAELEMILRQLREEEIERMLAMLEHRFRKMLKMQLIVYEDTKRLDQIPLEERGRSEDIEAGKLSFAQRKIVLEADRTQTLLLDEGSSVAFPEVVNQMRDDMQQVVERLAQTKVGLITQGIEEDIIAALEEMIDALQKAQHEMEQQQQQQQQQSSQPQDQPLVDAIAELKMIRALQVRVNKRTTRYAQLLDNIDDPKGQATSDELVKALRKLGLREERIQRITRDIVLGKNQ